MDNLASRYKKIYSEYLETVAPLIIRYETLVNKFPIGILNEIRAVFGHLAKYNVSEQEETKEKELSKAENHFTRLKRDCYKYLCMAYEDKYKEFQNLAIDKFEEPIKTMAIKVSQLHEKAIDNVLIAREMELSIYSEEKHEKSFNYYEQAFEYFNKIQDIIKQTIEKI